MSLRLGLLTALAALILISGCGGGSDTDSTQTASAGQGETQEASSAETRDSGQSFTGQVITSQCPSEAEASSVVGQPMENLGGTLTEEGIEHLGCSFVEAGLSPREGTKTSIGITMANTSGVYTADQIRETAEKGCQGSTADSCDFDVQDTPDLGPGTFRYYTTFSVADITQAACNIVVTDIGGAPLQLTAMARGGQKFSYDGSMEEEAICDIAEGLIEPVLQPRT